MPLTFKPAWQGARAILDNSSFAGVMRLYAPDLPSHRIFLNEFPQHREVDETSLATFLTAMCSFDEILLESSSRTEQASAADVQKLPRSQYERSWVDQLLELLPPEVAEIISAGPSPDGSSAWVTNLDAEHKAFDVFCSPLADRARLRDGEKLPNVYTARDYVFRKRFMDLNERHGSPLNEHLLAQAMFLHRGLFLEGYARDIRATYLPYLYRGRMLASLPPLVGLEADFGDLRAPLSQDDGEEVDYIRELSVVYYDLLNKLTWVTYDQSVPFVGASILAASRGSLRSAFDTALELRERAEIRNAFRALDESRASRDRVMYDIWLDEVRRSLEAAARALGYGGANPQMKAFYDLVTFWMPKGVKESLEAAMSLAPPRIMQAVSRLGSKLLSQDSFQLLFLNHVAALRDHPGS